MEKTIVYPHMILVLRKILAFFLFFPLPVGIILKLFFPEYLTQGLLVLGALSAIFFYYSFMNYTHTMLTLEEGGLILRKGWIPNTQNSIFWINIKDADTSAGAMESMFGCGTIILRVSVRSNDEIIKIPFMTNVNEVYSLIREQITKQNAGARPVTYT